MDRRLDAVEAPSVLERYRGAFGEVDTRAMLQAGASLEQIDRIMLEAIGRGAPLTDVEIDAICPRERPVYAIDDLD